MADVKNICGLDRFVRPRIAPYPPSENPQSAQATSKLKILNKKKEIKYKDSRLLCK